MGLFVVSKAGNAWWREGVGMGWGETRGTGGCSWGCLCRGVSCRWCLTAL